MKVCKYCQGSGEIFWRKGKHEYVRDACLMCLRRYSRGVARDASGKASEHVMALNSRRDEHGLCDSRKPRI